MVGAIAAFAGLILVSIAILLTRDCMARLVWRWRNPPEKVLAQKQAYFQRLSKPDWVYYERHLGRAVPTALREWFVNPDRLDRSYEFGDYYINFSPVDAQGEQEAAWVLPGVVPFATSDGDPIYLNAGATESNAVHIAYHDGGGAEQLAPSIEEFLSGLRNVA